MELTQKYIEVKEFDVSDTFFDRLHDMGLEEAVIISKAISEGYIELPDDEKISYTIGGVAQFPDEEDIPFSLKFIKIEHDAVLLSDIQLISIDEYLDLINLNLYLKKYDEHTTSVSPKGDSKPSV
jgi:hypothetical protein|tara:strand:+ start:106 stop:480 length:375 start_codon:yes stop_codon:yes gene_type:complete